MKKHTAFLDKTYLSIQDGTVKLSLFALALPLFFETIGSNLIAMVQTILSSRYEGGFFVIALSVPTTVLSIFSSVITLFSTGLGILLSAYLGRKQYENCKVIIGSALLGSIFFSVLLALVGFLFAEPLLQWMGMNSEEYAPYLPYALKAFRFRCFFPVLSSVTLVFTAALRCYGYTKIGLIGGISANAVNAVATALAMYVFHMPKESAVSVLNYISLGSTIVNALIAFLVFKKQKIAFTPKINGNLLKKVVKIGFPASVSGIFYTVSVTVTSAICLKLPPAAYLAKNYISQIVFFVYSFGYSIGLANALMLGRVCGMGDLEWADKMHKQNLKIVLLCNGALSVLFALFARPMLRLFFAADDAVLAYANILWIDILVEQGRGMNHIGQNGLNATGDVHFTTIISILSCWICSVGLAYVFGILCAMSLYGIWIAFAIDELFRGTMYLLRWLKKDWQKRFQRLL